MHHFFKSLICFLVLCFVMQYSFASPQEGEKNKTEEQTQEEKKEVDPDSQETSEGSNSVYIEMFPRSEIEMAPPTDQLVNKESDLKHYLPPQLVQPLTVGDKEISTLIDTNSAPNSRGVMIFLPDWNQSVANPQIFAPLRNKFPEQGWTTISMLPPKVPENYPSLALEAKDKMDEEKKTIEAYQESLATLINAVTEKAQDYPGIIIIVAAGHNASILLNVFQEESAELPAAFILVSAYMNEHSSNVESATNLSQLELPVLDLYLKTDSSLVKESAMLRKKMVNQELKSNYRQVEIFNIQTGYYPKHALITSINGWLKSIGW